MRVGTILNTFKIVPKIVHDIQFPKTFPKHPKVSRKIADNTLYIFGKLLSDINAGRQLSPEQLLSMFELEAQIQELRDAGAEHFEARSYRMVAAKNALFEQITKGGKRNLQRPFAAIRRRSD